MRRCVRLLLTLAFGQPARAAPPVDLAAAFGALEDVRSVAISPDGAMVSYLTPAVGGGTALMVAPTAGGGAKPVFGDRPDQKLERCDWGSPDRLVCAVGMRGKVGNGSMVFRRLFALGTDGSGVRPLGHNQTGEVTGGFSTSDGTIIDWLADTPGKVLLAEHLFEEASIGTRLAQQKSGYRVVRLDLRNGQRVQVEPPVQEGVDFLTDGHGHVRVRAIRPFVNGALNYATVTYLQAGGRTDYSYRAKGDGRWQPLFSSQDGSAAATLTPLALDATGDYLFFLKSEQGRRALYKIALDGSRAQTLVLSRRDVDVDGLVQIGPYSRVVGARYTTDQEHVEWFDPALAALSERLAKALPGTPLVDIVDESRDGNRTIVFAGSDRDPGHYYVLDKATRKLTELAVVRSRLDGLKLGEVRAVTVRARDGTSVPAYLTLPPGKAPKGLPAIVMPHGGPAARDTWGFDWWPQYYAQLGYAVIQPNYRGSTGYGEAWYKKNGFKDWMVAMGDVNDAARWMIAKGIADPGRVAIVGWSYGGYAALQANVVDPRLYKAAIAVAPVTDLALLRDQQNEASSDYAQARAYIGTGASLTEGSPARRAAEIAPPVLMFQGLADMSVNPAQPRAMEAALQRVGKSVELVTYPGLGHALESSDARADMLRQSAAFLAKAMGAPAAPSPAH